MSIANAAASFSQLFAGESVTLADIAAMGWTATATPKEPHYFVVCDAQGGRVGSLIARSANQAIADLAAERARKGDPRVGVDLMLRALAT